MIFLLPFIFVICSICFISRFRRNRNVSTIAFFHPYCNAGGGGERVLWCAVQALQKRYPQHMIVIYTGDSESDADIFKSVKSRFNLTINAQNLQFVRLISRRLLEADLYPVFTLLGQALGGLLVGVECLIRVTPGVFIDTVGCPLTMPVFALIGGSYVVCYVHYPVISTDMIQLVQNRQLSYNNSTTIRNSRLLSTAKLAYYRAFAKLYAAAGWCSDLTMVNGTWTKNHIIQLWPNASRVRIVFPPIDTKTFKSIDNQSESDLINNQSIRIVSIGQFRPEKNHQLQLETVADLIHNTEIGKRLLDENNERVKVTLICIGGCRNEGDRNRVAALRAKAEELNIADYVEIIVNLPFDKMLDELRRAMIGIHSMTNEHFGISVVETLASGTIMVAHNSGGPKLDIVVPSNCDPKDQSPIVGYLAETAVEYADCIRDIVRLNTQQRESIRKSAKQHCIQHFGDEIFAKQFLDAFETIVAKL